MSGHSKWSTIKHKKGAADAKRSKVFTKIIREVTTAARLGGEDPSANPRLRAAIQLAKANNMPAENLKRAIQKGAGGGKEEGYEAATYEGYGPHQLAVIVECLTDNKNRTIANLRTIFNKNGGNLGSANSVAYNFDLKGVIEIDKAGMEEDQLTEHAIEGGAEDIDTSGEAVYQVITEAAELHQVTGYLEGQGIEIQTSGLAYLPKSHQEVNSLEQAKAALQFLEALEDDDDVQKVHSNFDLSDEVAAALEAER